MVSHKTVLSMAIIVIFFGLYFYVNPFFTSSLCCSIQDTATRDSVTLYFRLAFIILMLWAMVKIGEGDK